MKFFTLYLASALSGSALNVAQAQSFDWPQWQGPDRNAVSKEKGLLQEWPKEGPALAWKATDLGGGDSAPAVAAGRIYGMGNRGEDEVVWALSEKDGSPIWSARLGAAYKQSMPQGKEGPACTPTVDGDRLYVEGLGGAVACVQVADGKIVWQLNLKTDFNGQIPAWSYRESPLVDGDKLIVTPGADDAVMVALDKKTGKTLWKTKLPSSGAGAGAGGPGGPGGGGGGRGRGGFASSGASYASAIAIDFEGQRQYVQFAGKALIGVAAVDGKFLWRYDHPANGMAINCSTAVYQDGQVFAASAYGAGGGLVKLSKDGSGNIRAEEVYFSKKMQNHHGGMILADGALFGANGGNEGGWLACLDWKTGNVLWDEREDGKKRAPKGSIALADGRLYYRTEKDGTILLLEANAKEYVEHGRFSQPERTSLPAWSHPVIANGKMYIRDQNLLLCYNVKAAKP